MTKHHTTIPERDDELSNEKFTAILRKYKYKHKVEGGDVLVTHQGSVYLNSLTTLPEGVKFENQGPVYLGRLKTLPEGVKFENKGPVYLNSLTTLPEGVKFENKGSVYLNSLTTLPEGVKFENQGYVDLSSLTTLPEGVKFENKGSVDLSSLTTLPEGVKFENKGSVDLDSLTGSHTYMAKPRQFKSVDGITMLIGKPKRNGSVLVYPARYFAGGPIEDMNKCYVASSGDLYAHGDSIKTAIEDLEYKVADSADKSEIAAQVKATGIVTLAQFRGITGACRDGIRQHLSGLGIDLSKIDSMKLEDALSAMSGTSYGAEFSKHLEAAQ